MRRDLERAGESSVGPEDWEVGKPHGQIQLPANFNGIVPIAPWFRRSVGLRLEICSGIIDLR